MYISKKWCDATSIKKTNKPQAMLFTDKKATIYTVCAENICFPCNCNMNMTYLTSRRGPLKVLSGFLAPLYLAVVSPLSLSSALNLSSMKFTWNNKRAVNYKRAPENWNCNHVTSRLVLSIKLKQDPLTFMWWKLSVNEAPWQSSLMINACSMF